MVRVQQRFRPRLILAAAILTITAGAAGAATVHRMTVTPSTGSLGSAAYVQDSVSGGALQMQVGSPAYTGLPYPFGGFGFYDNSSQFGIGLVGVAQSGYGVAGASHDSNAAVFGYAEGTGPAVMGMQTSATNPSDAIIGEAAGQANGVTGYTPGLHSTPSTFYAGVRGSDTANDGGYNDGVLGSTTQDGYGVEGTAGTGSLGAVGGIGTATHGVVAMSDTRDAVLAEQMNPASTAVSPTTTQQDGLYASATNGAGVYSYSLQDPAIFAEMGCNVYTSDATSTGQNCSGLFVQEDGTSGYPLEVYEPGNASCTYPFFLDSDGNLYICGHVYSAGGTLARTRNPRSDASTYGAQQTESTVEDFGSAQLVGGSAHVALGADFKTTIDTGRPYMVFLTPYADTNGLYVASRTPDGFVVREAKGGRSSTSFDYRIVARPYGERLARLPHADAMGQHAVRDRTGASPNAAATYAALIAAAQQRALHLAGLHKQLGATPTRTTHPPTIPTIFKSSMTQLTLH